VLVPFEVLDIDSIPTDDLSLLLCHLVAQNLRIKFVVQTVLNGKRSQLKSEYLIHLCGVALDNPVELGYHHISLADLALQFHIRLCSW
jgi:hypothetical protein